MRHFIHYHNSHRMGYSASSFMSPRIVTNKPVRQLPGATIWLVSAEGLRSPKLFYLGAVFTVIRIAKGCYEHPDFKNSAHGVGHIYGETLLLTALPWFEKFKIDQINFRNSLTEITSSPIISHFRHLSGYEL